MYHTTSHCISSHDVNSEMITSAISRFSMVRYHYCAEYFTYLYLHYLIIRILYLTLPYFTVPCPLSSYLPLYHLTSPNFSLTPSSHSLSYLLSLFLPSPFFSISFSDPFLRTQDGEWFPCSHVIKGSVSALV